MPSKIRAFCNEGKWHDIEVEDDVSIYAEYPNGATGVFVTTTGDYPGSNRLEITLDSAKIVCENGEKITLTELETPISVNCAESEEGFAEIKTRVVPVETDGLNEQHPGVLNAFASHILRGTPLVAKGEEGINGVRISNAAHLSSWLDKTVELPVDEDLFYSELQKKIVGSKGKKEVTEKVNLDMSGTY